MFLDANSLHGLEMFQKLHVDGFKWKENVSKFDEEFIKNYYEHSNKGYALEVNVESTKDLHIVIAIYHSYQKK